MEPITIQVAPDAAHAYRNAREEQRQRIAAIVESQLRQGVPMQPMTQLPEWCNVYEGLTDEEIDDIESAIVRDPGTRRFD